MGWNWDGTQDIAPLRPGHTLVIPKPHISRVSDLPDDLAAHCGVAVSRLARAIAAGSSLVVHRSLPYHPDPRCALHLSKKRWRVSDLCSYVYSVFLRPPSSTPGQGLTLTRWPADTCCFHSAAKYGPERRL